MIDDIIKPLSTSKRYIMSTQINKICVSEILALAFLIGCNGRHSPSQKKFVSEEDKVKAEVEQFNMRQKYTKSQCDTSKIQVIACKRLYNDDLVSYYKSTIVNRTNKTIKGIHAYSGYHNIPDGFLAFKVRIKPHSSTTIKSKYSLCAYYLSGAIYSNGEFQDLMFIPKNQSFKGGNINNPIKFGKPVSVNE